MFFIFFIWVSVFLLSPVTPGSYILNYTTLALWFFTAIFIIKKNNEFSIVYSFFFWSYSTVAISCALIETGVVLPELGMVSFMSGALSRNLSLVFFSTLSAATIFNFLNSYLKVNVTSPYLINQIIKHIVFVLYCLLVIILFGIYIKYGSPNNYGSDRFYYWNHVAPSWGNTVRALMEQLSFAVGVMFASERKNRYLLIFVFSLVTQLLVGEKFTGIFQGFIFFLLPIFLIRGYNFYKAIFNFKSILIAAVVFGLLMGLVLKSYLSINGQSGAALLSLATRLSAQSQMWWAIDQLSTTGFNYSTNLITDYAGIGVDTNETGIFYLMSLIMPQHLFTVYKDAKIALTMAYPVTNIYFFGQYLSILPTVIIGAVCGFAFWFLCYSIKIKDYILIFLSFKIYYITIQILLMGGVYLLFSEKFYLTIIFSLIYASFSKHFIKRIPL